MARPTGKIPSASYMDKLKAMAELSQGDLNILLEDDSSQCTVDQSTTDSVGDMLRSKPKYGVSLAAAGNLVDSTESLLSVDDDNDEDEPSSAASDQNRNTDSDQPTTRNRKVQPTQRKMEQLERKDRTLSQQADLMRTIEALERRLEQSSNEKRILETKLSTLSTTTTMTPRQITLQSDSDRQTIDAIRNAMASGSVIPTEMQYVEMQAIPDTRKSLLDSLRSFLFEQVYTLKSEINSLRRDREHGAGVAQDLHALQMQKKLLQDSFDEKEKRITSMAARIHTLESDLSIERDRCSVLRREVDSVDEIKVKLDQANAKLGQEQRERTMLNEELQQLKEFKRSAAIQKEEYLRTIDILKVDKTYLEKEAASATHRVTLLEDKLAQRSSELEAVKESQLGQYQTILQTNEQHRVEYEKRLQEELASIRCRTGEDLEDIRRNTRDMHDREVKILRDQLTTEQEQLRRCRFENDQLKSTLNSLTQQYIGEKSKLESDLAAMSQQCKGLSFDCERIKLVYEDTVNQIKRVQLDNEKYAQKIDIITKEYQQLQVDTTKRLVESHQSSTGPRQDTKENCAPTAAPAPPHESRDALARIVRLTEQVNFLDQLLSSVKQPHHALIVMLRKKEEQLAELRAEHESTVEKLTAVEREREVIMKERDVLLADVKTLVNNRQKMDQIRKLVGTLINKPVEKAQSRDVAAPRPFMVRSLNQNR